MKRADRWDAGDDASGLHRFEPRGSREQSIGRPIGTTPPSSSFPGGTNMPLELPLYTSGGHVFQNAKLPIGCEHSRRFVDNRSRVIDGTEHDTADDDIDRCIPEGNFLTNPREPLNGNIETRCPASALSAHGGIRFEGDHRCDVGLPHKVGEHGTGPGPQIEDTASQSSRQRRPMIPQEKPVRDGHNRIVCTGEKR